MTMISIAAAAVVLALGGGAATAPADSPPIMPDCSDKQTRPGAMLLCGRVALHRGDAVEAERQFRRSLEHPQSWEQAGWAVRSIGDARLASGGDMAEVDALALEWKTKVPWAEGRHFDHARAWMAFRQGRYAEAAELLKPLTAGGHHTLSIAPIWHADLGDAYAALGRTAEAQGQWRMALATAWRPDDTGWDRAATAADLARSVAEHGAAVMVPLSDEGPDVRLVNLAAVIRENGIASYGSVLALAGDRADGTAWQVSHYEVKCGPDDSPLRPVSMRLLRRIRRDAAGTVIGQDGPLDWIDPRSEMARLDTEARLACFTPLEGVPDVSVDYAGVLRELRAAQ